MNKFLIVLLFLFHLPAYSQNTIPVTAKPVFAFKVETFQSRFLDTFFLDLQLLDTIDGVLWSPIYQVSYLDGSNELVSGFPKLVGHQREEGNKTYFREENFLRTREGIMYDFDVSAGDSIWALSPDSHPLLLDSLLYVVDSVNFSNCTRLDSVKVVFTHALYDYPNRDGVFYNDVWIETVGSQFHGIYPLSCIDESGGICEAFYSEHFALINEEWIDVRAILCEEIQTSTTNIVTRNLATSIFPNPTNGSESLTVKAGNYNIDKLSIFDVAGRQVMQFYPGGVQQMNFDINSLSKGLYMIKVVSTRGEIQLAKTIIK